MLARLPAGRCNGFSLRSNQMRSIACREKRTVPLEFCRNPLIECGAPTSAARPARKGSTCLLSNQPAHTACSGTTNDAQRTISNWLPLHAKELVDLIGGHKRDGIVVAREDPLVSLDSQNVHEDSLTGWQKRVHASCVARLSPSSKRIGLTSNYCG